MLVWSPTKEKSFLTVVKYQTIFNFQKLNNNNNKKYPVKLLEDCDNYSLVFKELIVLYFLIKLWKCPCRRLSRKKSMFVFNSRDMTANRGIIS